MLQKVGLAPGIVLEELTNVFGIVISGKEDDADFGMRFPYLLRRGNAVQARHLDIHDDHVGLQDRHHLNCGVAIAEHAHEVDGLVAGKKHSKGFSDDLLVIDDQHFYLIDCRIRIHKLRHAMNSPSEN